MENKNYALKISLVYLIFGIFWILLSDALVGSLSPNREVATFLSVIKGWFFVGLSALLIFTISRRYIRRLLQANQLQQKSFNELTVTHEKLVLTNTLLSTIQETTVGLINELNVDVLLSKMIQTLSELANTPHSYIYLINEEQQTYDLKVGLGLYQNLAGKFSIAQNSGQVGLVFRTGHASVIEDYKSWEHRILAPEISAVKSSINVPLKSEEKVIGTLGLSYTEMNQHFNANHVDLLERFAALASIALGNAQLHTQLQQKLALLKAVPDLLLLINHQGRFIDYNQPTDFNLYVSPEKLLGKTILDVFPHKLAQQALKAIQKTILSGEIQLFEYQLPQNNQLHYFEARFVKSSETEAMAMIRDITYKKQIEAKLEFLSLHDALTKVNNRTYFEDTLLKIRNQPNQKIGIMICDVDGLKLINDALGHYCGDILLKTVASILQSVISAPNIVARIGGDEFALILFNPDHEKMANLSTDIKTSIKKYNADNPQLPLSLSVGWAEGFSDAVDTDALFKEADHNMYREKMHHDLSNRSAIVQTMMKALEARDFITEGHGDRLQIFVEKIAQKLHLSAPLIADLKLLAKFHDIGKVGIPDHILFKKGPLTKEETLVMRSHCDIGFRIAKSAPDLTPIAEWILKHQEWWNGQGYPLQLTGEEIPLPCRILALVDAFDAMTNDRPYRKALSTEEAIDELRRCAGTQFDPVLTKIFIDILNEESL